MNSTITLAAAAALTMTLAVHAAAQDASSGNAPTGQITERAPETGDTPPSAMMQDEDTRMMGRMMDGGMMDGPGMMMDPDSMTEEQRQAMSDMMKSCHRMMMAMSEPGPDGRINADSQ